MGVSSPQFLYLVSILPSLFGLVLVGEGINRCVHAEWKWGLVSVVLGTVFVVGIILIYFFFNNYEI